MKPFTVFFVIWVVFFMSIGMGVISFAAHEMVHVTQTRNAGNQVNEVCFAGYLNEGSFIDSAFGWVDTSGKSIFKKSEEIVAYSVQAAIVLVLAAVTIIGIFKIGK